MRKIFDKNISICRIIILKILIKLDAKAGQEISNEEKEEINHKIDILKEALEIIPKN